MNNGGLCACSSRFKWALTGSVLGNSGTNDSRESLQNGSLAQTASISGINTQTHTQTQLQI